MAPITLQILHAADQEAGLPAIQDAVNFSAVIERLAEDYENTLRLSSGDIYIPGPFLSASTDIYGEPGIADILINNALGFEAVALGNHEFDLGTGVLSTLIRPNPEITGPGIGDEGYLGTQFPFLGVNLDFSTDANLADLVVEDGQSPLPNSLAGSVVLETGGQPIGIVGVTTPLITTISSPGDVGVFPTDPNDFEELASIIQEEVDALTADGINKIIVMMHLQQISFEQEVATFLRDVDVIIAGGSDTLLAAEGDILRDGDVIEGPYPIEVTDAAGQTVFVINTDSNYRYVGRLIVDFDADGIITSIGEQSGAYATDQAGVNRVYGAEVNPRDFANPIIVEVTDAIGDFVLDKDGNLFGRTDVFLNGDRGSVRTQETNLGNLTADANLFMAQFYDPTTVVSIKNGGGIRDSIGSATIPAGAVDDQLLLTPPPANPIVGKEEGQVSQLDIENALRFNNGLSLLTVTAEELWYLLEWGVAGTAPGATPGRFPQVGGLSFSFDATQQPIVFGEEGSIATPGERIQSLVLLNPDGSVADIIVEENQVQGDPDREIRLVTLDFLANGGDGYPFNFYGENRVDLASESLPAGAPDVANFTTNGTEQDALAEFLAANFEETPFAIEDTGPELDERIQNLAFREDTVLSGISDPGPIDGTPPSEPSPMGVEITGSFEDDVIEGTDGDDILRGQPIRNPSQISSNDTLIGGEGNDHLSGGFGDDILRGGPGDDKLRGGLGDDYLDGGPGNDILIGGPGSDIFVIAVREGVDTIRDFEVGIDLIGIDGISFGDLSFSQTRSHTLISAEDSILAKVIGVMPETLAVEANFTAV